MGKADRGDDLEVLDVAGESEPAGATPAPSIDGRRWFAVACGALAVVAVAIVVVVHGHHDGRARTAARPPVEPTTASRQLNFGTIETAAGDAAMVCGEEAMPACGVGTDLEFPYCSASVNAFLRDARLEPESTFGRLGQPPPSGTRWTAGCGRDFRFDPHPSFAPVVSGCCSSPLTVRPPAGWSFGFTFAAFGSLWVETGRTQCAVGCVAHWWRVDPESGFASLAPTIAGSHVHALTVGAGAIWTLNARLDDTPLTVTRTDPITGHADRPIAIAGTGIEGDTNPRVQLAFGAGSLWVYDGGNTAIRIDPSLRRVVARIRIPRPANGMVVDAAGVWLIDYGNGGLERIDPRTNRAAIVVNTCCFAQSIAADGHHVWFTLATEHGRITVMRVEEHAPFSAVDTHIDTADVTSAGGTVWYLGTGSEQRKPCTYGEPGAVGTIGATDLRAHPVGNVHLVSRSCASRDTEGGIVAVGDSAWVVDDIGQTLTRVTAG